MAGERPGRRRARPRAPRPGSAALALSLLALAGCATGAAFLCPARGGPAWRDVASLHFVVRTDLDVGDATRLVARMERLRTAVLSALFDEAPQARSGVEVVAFRSEAEYRSFAPPGVDAYYLRSAGGPPRIVLAGQLDRRQRAMLAHELTHHYLSSIFVRQPRWFSEGLATLMEPVGDQGDGPLVTVGQAPASRMARLRNPVNRVTTRELLQWEGGPTPAHPALDYYGASWLLVHYLAYRTPGGFADLQRRLVKGESPEASWRGAFPQWDPARPRALEGLDQALETYLNAEAQTRYRQVRETWDGQPEVRLIPTPEVHAIRLALWNQGPDKGVAALRAEVGEALSEDPDHPLALQLQASLTGEPPLPLARRAVASHPDDPRAWTFLAGALKGEAHDEERLVAYRTAAGLAEGNAAALHNLAVELLVQGRSGEGLPVAKEAVRLAPWSPPLLDGYAAVLADLGLCTQAIDVQSRALEVLSERSPEAARQALRDRLQQILIQCRMIKPAPPAAPPASPPASPPSAGSPAPP
jgi:tetratricopeptide (TPR) repeat protein